MVHRMAQRGPPPPTTGGGGYSRMSSVNTGAATSGHIKVVVRVRPENQMERAANQSIVVRPMDEHVLIFDPREHGSPEFYQGKKRAGRDLLKKKNKDMKFAFDRVYDMGATNEEIYDHSTKEILDGLLDGFNSSVFAYGATGAGKTFTMLGNPDNPGVIFLTMMDLYKRMEDIREEKTCDVAVSYLEVYNEQIRDLLLPSDYLPLREDPQKGVIVTGLSLHKPRTAQELLHMLHFGNTNRTQHPTDANAESSRSHAVFQVFVKQRDRTGSLSTDVRVGKMSLIDLAGSERATVTTNRGARFREGANINRSLLALGNCINALAEGKSKGFVPYRNSKLTRLLKDSLGGNCRTVMIAAVSPSSMTYEDTYNTLKYANRAKNIKANLKRNVVNVDFHVTKYAKIVEELRQEVSELKVKVKQYEESAVVATKSSLDSPYRAEIDRLQGTLLQVFQQRLSIRKEVMEFEGSERDLAYKIHRKERHLSRISLVFSDPVVASKITNRLERYITNARQRQSGIQDRKKEVEQRMEENVLWLQKVGNEVKQSSKEDCPPEVLEATTRAQHLEVELRDTRRQVKYLKKLCRAQERDAQSSEKLILTLLQTARRQYLLLKGHSLMTSGLQSEYDTVQHMVEGEREIAWADQSTCALDAGDTTIGAAGDFNINTLVDFPVLSCVPATPSVAPPRSQKKSGYGLTPGRTPASASSFRGPLKPNLANMPKLCLDAASPTPPADQKENKPVVSQSMDPTAPNKSIDDQTVSLDCAAVRVPLQRNLLGELSQNGAQPKALPSRVPVHCATTGSQNCVLPASQQAATCSRTCGGCSSSAPIEDSTVTLSSSATSLNSTFTRDSGMDSSSSVENRNVPRVNSGTITKSRPSEENNKENPGQKNPRLGVVRAMDFSNIPATPPGKLSFADAVKSPARVFQDGNGFSPRSPLSSRENLPASAFSANTNSALDNNSKQPNRRFTFAANEMSKYQQPPPLGSNSTHKTKYFGPQRVTATEQNTAEALNRMGLPSAVKRFVRSMSQSSVAVNKPSYMQMTKAAARRQRGHRRSISTEVENVKNHTPAARRISANDTTHRKPFGARTLLPSRSKSSSNLAKKSTFF